MIRSISTAWRIAFALLALSTCYLVFAQSGVAGKNQKSPNPRDHAVTASAQAANPEQGGKPLDEQKSAPVRLIVRHYDMNVLTHEPKAAETVFRGRIL